MKEPTILQDGATASHVTVYTLEDPVVVFKDHRGVNTVWLHTRIHRAEVDINFLNQEYGHFYLSYDHAVVAIRRQWLQARLDAHGMLAALDKMPEPELKDCGYVPPAMPRGF